MKMSKYRNKRIFRGLSLALIFLIVASFVASSVGDQGKDEIGVDRFYQDPPGPVTKGTPINFSWVVIQPGPPFLSPYHNGTYCLLIERPHPKEKEDIKIEYTINSTKKFSSFYNWTVPDDEPIGEHIANLRVPCEEDLIGAHTKFKVVPTVLVIRKFNDTNRNSRIDGGDEGLQGWEFKVTDPDGNTKTYSTELNGEKRIEVLDAGKEYTVEEILKPRWKAILPSKQRVNVLVGETKTVQFLNKKINTTILIQKFNDTNRNYEIDYGDEKLRDWKFNVTNPAGETRLYKTDAYGERLIDILDGKEGDYEIVEIIKEPGWKLIKIDTDKTATILDQGEQWIKIRVEEGKESKVRFLNTDQPELVISKFYDHNLNGKRDGREEGLENWEFEIKFPDGSVKNVPTEPDGRIIINNPPIGTYTITELTTKPCWNSSSPTEQKAEIKPGQGAEVEFGNYEVGTLLIHKYNDTNHNGNWDARELPLPNWGFRIKNSKGGGATGRRDFIDITKYTDDNGSITLDLPADVRYNVSENLRVGWSNSTPLMQSVYIKPCEVTNPTFGNYKPSPIIIYKFNDTNRNGDSDSGEEGLAGWDFRIAGPGVNKIITTDEKGKARFDDAIPGLYSIEEIMRDDQRGDWNATTQPIRLEVEEGKKVIVEFGNHLIGDPCAEYGIYMLPEDAPRWHKNSDENLNVTKYLEPHIVHCDNPNPDKGEIINVTLRVCVFPVMAPTDIVLAVDTSGSLVETGGGLLEVMRDGITDFIQKNEARFGENVRIGLVNWDDDIDETVNLTTDYDEIKKACGNFSGNLQEFTLYHVGLKGSIEVFNRSPREDVKKIIVFVTDAKGEYRNITRFPDPEVYTIHSITIGPTQNEEIANMLGNLTSQYEGENVSINESYEELEKALTTLTVSSIERRILNNVTVIETLPKYLRALNESYAVPPTSVQINQDGIDWSTETMVWDISDLSSDQCWESTFKALFCCRMPADESHPVGVPKKTSEVTYTDPANSSITRHLPIPEGGIWIQPRPWWERVPVWLWALLGAMAIAIIALAIYCFRRTPKQET